MEIVITGVIVALAAYILYKNIKSSYRGKCNCAGCNKKCSRRIENK